MSARGKTTQLHNMYVADFETTDTDQVYRVEKDGNTIHNQRVWLAGIKNLKTMQTTVFNNLDDFMEHILSRGNNVNTEYAFHNLKFDGSYIVPWLLRHNYRSVQTKPEKGEFSVLVDQRNAWYSLTIQVTVKRKVTIWDSLKLFPVQLMYLHDVYGTPTKKINEPQSFYLKDRPEGYIPDDEDLRYLENDLSVLAETLRKHIERYGLRFKKTQASQSFYNFEQSFEAWKFRFPALTDEDDASIRKAYWGGISYVHTFNSGKDFENVVAYDINSSYPHKAAEERLPYGEVLKVYSGEPPDMSKFWVSEAYVKFTLKDKYKLPCIPTKAITENRPITNEKWLTDSYGLVKIKFSSIDYLTIQDSYDFEVVEWCWTRHWAHKKHKEIAKFVHTNNDIKVEYKKKSRETHDENLRIEYLTMSNRAKIDNNSFYGKFGEDIVKEGKTPYLEDDHVVWKVDRTEVQSERARKYLPVAIAITAYGRQQLVHLANRLGKHFIYCDTDSVHFCAEGEHIIKDLNIEVDNTKLGAWSKDGSYLKGRYIRAKCYMERTEEGIDEVTLAGLPADKGTGQFSKSRSVITWDNFQLGHIVPPEQSNKLRTVNTDTGAKLLPVGFEIKKNVDALQTWKDKLLREVELESDIIKLGVKQHGFIKTIKPDEYYYHEYREMSTSVKRKYFRREGKPLDVFAQAINLEVNEILEKLSN